VKREAEAFFEILRGVGKGKFDIIGSIILEDEIYEIKDERKRIAVTRLVARAISNWIDTISESKQREIKRLTGIKDEDAFHLAAAVEGKAECFITVDDDILTKAGKIKRYGIKVLNPINLVEVQNEH
jgi:hypothetical protein